MSHQCVYMVQTLKQHKRAAQKDHQTSHFHICKASSWSSGVWHRSEQDELQKTERKSCRKSDINEDDESWAHYRGPQCAPITIDTIKVMVKWQRSKTSQGQIAVDPDPMRHLWQTETQNELKYGRKSSLEQPVITAGCCSSLVVVVRCWDGEGVFSAGSLKGIFLSFFLSYE